MLSNLSHTKHPFIVQFPIQTHVISSNFPHQKRPEGDVFSHTSRLFVDDIETGTRLYVPDFSRTICPITVNMFRRNTSNFYHITLESF